MKTVFSLTLGSLLCGLALTTNAATSTILGWNNLGMHCMDSDYSVFTILPPYNTIEAQVIVNGALVRSSNNLVTYQAVTDATGSFNSTSIGKGNFYDWTADLYGPLAPNMGLAGKPMPGSGRVDMIFEQTNTTALVNWWRAEGIPLTPYDDAMHKNPYPMMRLIAWNGATALATNDIVLPVSDEMDCRACHASGTEADAMPAAGWVWDGLPERDFRLNILRKHDESQFAGHAGLYHDALAAFNFNPAGLYRTVTVDQKPILCAKCHASEALGAPSFQTVPPLTASVHSFHAHVTDPLTGMSMDSAVNRAACYRCHPGSTTKCLRGAMGGAVAQDGSMEMQCQNCHGNMSEVGKTRTGWLDEPNCQSCHTGTATSNEGKIRFTSCFTNSTYGVRVPTNRLFATTMDTPIPGKSLYRWSSGHGGLQCSACHGSTHAEFPSTHANDNRRNIELQGHVGVMVECKACHTAMPDTANNGPHGLHAIGQGWLDGTDGVTKHADVLNTVGTAYCQGCHGIDFRGTPLSRAHADRTLTASLDTATVTVKLFRGAEVGCYNCHQGESSGDPNTAAAPAASNVSTNTTNDKLVAIRLGAPAPTWRIIRQPANGSVGVTNNTAAYFPGAGFVGTDTFTFAAYDGSKNSVLATGTVVVAQGPFSVDAMAYVPPSYPAAWPVPFNVVPKVTNNSTPATYAWTFGDGAVSAENMPTHVYNIPGSYNWSVTVTVAGVSVVRSGSIAIGQPMRLVAAQQGNAVNISWPATLVDAVLEGSSVLGPGAQWRWITNAPTASGGQLSVSLPASGPLVLRLNRPW